MNKKIICLLTFVTIMHTSLFGGGPFALAKSDKTKEIKALSDVSKTRWASSSIRWVVD
jgi:hypothetical protein